MRIGKSAEAGIKSALPGLPTKAHWDDPSKDAGLMYLIKETIPKVKQALEPVITITLQNHPNALVLANKCLDETVSFVTQFMTFVSKTYDNLTLAGFPSQSAWNLVASVIKRMFSVDFDLVRATVREQLSPDQSNRKRLAASVLFSTFATVQKQEEFLKFNIENHPAVSAAQVRYLMTNSGLQKIHTVNSTLNSLKTQNKELREELKKATASIKEATSAAERAQKAATTASNNYDSLKKELNKLKDKK